MEIYSITVAAKNRAGSLTYPSLIEGREDMLALAKAGKDLAGRTILHLCVRAITGDTFTFRPDSLVSLLETITEH